MDKRQIFLDKQDYLRFIHNLFEFNDQKPSITNNSRLFAKSTNIIDLGGQYARERLVDIHAFCLMPNHYHLLISPNVDKSIPKFMMKLNVGYAKYFNQKYKRSGTLFQSRYKSVLVEKEAHFLHLPYYIHFNPLDLSFPEWRESKIGNAQKAIEFLNNYRWSSHLDYLGKQNFPSVTQREFLLESFEGSRGYKGDIEDWFKGMEIEGLKDFILE